MKAYFVRVKGNLPFCLILAEDKDKAKGGAATFFNKRSVYLDLRAKRCKEADRMQEDHIKYIRIEYEK